MINQSNQSVKNCITCGNLRLLDESYICMAGEERPELKDMLGECPQWKPFRGDAS
jgi:hypothetical protein